MTAGEVAAVITAVAGLVTAITALVHTIRLKTAISTWRKILPKP